MGSRDSLKGPLPAGDREKRGIKENGKMTRGEMDRAQSLSPKSFTDLARRDPPAAFAPASTIAADPGWWTWLAS
jgi:hypothetical protein